MLPSELIFSLRNHPRDIGLQAWAGVGQRNKILRTRFLNTRWPESVRHKGTKRGLDTGKCRVESGGSGSCGPGAGRCVSRERLLRPVGLPRPGLSDVAPGCLSVLEAPTLHRLLIAFLKKHQRFCSHANQQYLRLREAVTREQTGTVRVRICDPGSAPQPRRVSTGPSRQTACAPQAGRSRVRFNPRT